MALTKVTDKQLIQYVEALIPDNPESESKKRTENIRETILNLHQDVEDAKAIRGTEFGAYNAITDYTDHVIATKDPNRRLDSAWFGTGEKLEVKAFQLAQDVLLSSRNLPSIIDRVGAQRWVSAFPFQSGKEKR